VIQPRHRRVDACFDLFERMSSSVGGRPTSEAAAVLSDFSMDDGRMELLSPAAVGADRGEARSPALLGSRRAAPQERVVRRAEERRGSGRASEVSQCRGAVARRQARSIVGGRSERVDEQGQGAVEADLCPVRRRVRRAAFLQPALGPDHVDRFAAGKFPRTPINEAALARVLGIEFA
jgi:hypothetical protein